MVTFVKGLKRTKEYVELQLNNAINLKIFRKPNAEGNIRLKYSFKRNLITEIEAKEIIDYFMTVESDGIL